MHSRFRTAACIEPLALAIMALLIAAASAAPALAWEYPENQSGYTEHKFWVYPDYRSRVNLLNENTSFELGDAATSTLDGGYFDQGIFEESLVSRDSLTSGRQRFSFDTSTKVHGTRSLKIDLSTSMYTEETGHFCIGWDWVAIPADSAGNYEISFYARAAGTAASTFWMGVLLFHLNPVTGGWEREWLKHVVPSDTTCNGHENLNLSAPVSSSFTRLTGYTKYPLVAGDKYQLWIGSGTDVDEEGSVPAGMTLWLDAVQLTKFDADQTPKPFSCHTAVEELFLSMGLHGQSQLLRDNIFLPDQADDIEGDIEIYANTLRLAGTLTWTLYRIDESGANAVDQGEITTLNNRRRNHYRVDLDGGVNGEFGVYKWIVEFVDFAGLVTDRQETSFALVRDAVAPATGQDGNFGAHLGVVTDLGYGNRPYPHVLARGPFSVREALGYANKLGFHRERVFAAYDRPFNCWPDVGCDNRYDFYSDEAALQGIRQTPVITAPPPDDLADWSSWVSTIADQYGAGGQEPRMFEWQIRNERNNHFAPSCDVESDPEFIDQEANLICLAGEAIPDSGNEIYTTLGGSCVYQYLSTLLDHTGGDSAKAVKDILDGVTVNSYMWFDAPTASYIFPEMDVWGGDRATVNLRHAKDAVQVTRSTGIKKYMLTETGYAPGWIQADRAAFVDGHLYTDRSGSIELANEDARKMIRWELAWLSEGAAPIYYYGIVARRDVWFNGSYGLMQGDGMPTGLTAAQAQLNAELVNAELVRRIPADDLVTPDSSSASPDTRVTLFKDGSDYVLVGWTKEGEQTVRFPGAFQNCDITSRDMNGNASTIASGSQFDVDLTESPRYIRISGYSENDSTLTNGLDAHDPPAPTWATSGSPSQDGNSIKATVDFVDPGDGAEVRLSYRFSGWSTWIPVDTMEVWVNPDSSYAFAFVPDSTLGDSTDYDVRAVAVERTTGDLGDSLIAQVEYVLGKALKPVAAPIRWADQLTSPGRNPARSSVEWRGTASAPGVLRFQVFDVAGRSVRDIEQPQSAAGPFHVVWDGRTNSGTRSPSGIYLIRLLRDDIQLAKRRVVFMR